MNSEITNAFSDRLERIENMLLAMTLSDVKRQTPHEPIKIQSETSQTLVCKVRYDILASNIKNKLHDCLAGKGIEDLAFLNEINFEDLILSSLDTTESNEQSSSTAIIEIDESRRDDVVSTIINTNDTQIEPQSTTTSKTATSLKETSAPRAKKEAAPKADKEVLKAEKEAQKAEKDAQKAEQTEMKSCEKETREYDKALQKAKAAEAKLASKPRSIPDKDTTKKAEKEAEESKKKAEKEALKAEESKKKAEKEALKAEEAKKKAEKEAQKKALKEEADAQKKALKEAADAKKKADKEAKKSSTSKPRKSKDGTTTSGSGDDSISNTQTQSMSQPSQIMEYDELSEHSNESTTSNSSSKSSLSLIHPDTFNPPTKEVGIIRKGTPITELNEDEAEEDNSTNTYDDNEDEDDEDEDMDNKTDYEILTSWSIPSKPEVVYFAKRGQYIYERVKTEENPEGVINWNVSVGWLTSNGKHILTKSYAHYDALIVKT